MICLIAVICFTAARGEAQDRDIVDLSRIVVTASRMAQHDYKVASNVSVIDEQDIEASSARTVDEILKEALGVTIYDSGTPKTSNVDIRGFGDTANRNVLILVNDRKVNSIDVSGPDMLQIPLESVERIEIIRGGGSVLYGDNAVGGVVNIVTKEGKGDFSGTVGMSGGSYDSSATDLEVSGEYKDISYYLHSKYADAGGYRSNSDMLTKDFNSRLGYRMSDKFKVSMAASWHEDDYGLPGGLSDTELASLGRRGSADEDDFAKTKDRYVQLTLDVAPWPEDIDLGHLVLDASYRNRDTYALFASFGEYATKRKIDTIGITGKYIFDKKLFNKDFNFVTGIDYYTVENDILGSGSNSDDIRISKDDIGIYTFAEYEFLDDVYVNAGTRYQKASYAFDQKSGTPNFVTKTPQESVNMVGAKYEYSKGSNIFFNVQQTFRFLATDEWYDTWNGLNTDLDQQTGIQYEAGIKHDWDGRYKLTLTPYWIDNKREIFFDPSAGSFGFGANNNYDKTRRVGVEFGQEVNILRFWEADVFSRFDCFANYTYQLPRFNGGANDQNDIPLVARHQLSLGTNVEFKKKYRLSLIGTFVGARYAINDTLNETSPVKPYMIMDAKFTYDADPVELFVSVNNVFNEKYFSYVSKASSSITKNYYPAPERNVYAGMKWRF